MPTATRPVVASPKFSATRQEKPITRTAAKRVNGSIHSVKPPVAPGVTAEFEEVTPELAAKWLKRNAENQRGIKRGKINAYIRDMLAGNFLIHGQGVQFDKANWLIDGQNRLIAVVESGVTVVMLVVRGLDRKAQAVIDSGTPRTAGDALGMAGEKNQTSLAATTRVACRYVAGAITTNFVQPSNSELMSFVKANPDIRVAAELAGRYRGKVKAPVGIIGLAVWKLNRVDPAAAADFWDGVVKGTHLEDGDPRWALTDRLLKLRLTRTKVTAPQYLSLIFRAWKLWREGATTTVIPLPRTDRPGGVLIPDPK